MSLKNEVKSELEAGNSQSDSCSIDGFFGKVQRKILNIHNKNSFIML